MTSSGIFDTIFFKNAVPLIDEITPFSTLTLLAMGPSSIVQGYSFYDYQNACGFQDTSTIVNQLSTNIGSTVSLNRSTLQSELNSSIQTLTDSINFIGKTYVSTIPYSSEFMSSYTGTDNLYPGVIITPQLSLGNISSLITSSRYNVYVDLEYSLELVANDSHTWVNTVGVFNALGNPIYADANKGATTTTRVGNNTITNINTSLLFTPGPTQIPLTTSSFHFEVYLKSSINATTDFSPLFNIYVPDHIKLTLVPR